MVPQQEGKIQRRGVHTDEDSYLPPFEIGKVFGYFIVCLSVFRLFAGHSFVNEFYFVVDFSSMKKMNLSFHQPSHPTTFTHIL
jgi:hypothetical protein